MQADAGPIDEAERARLARANLRVSRVWSMLAALPILVVFAGLEAMVEVELRRANCPAGTFLSGTPGRLTTFLFHAATVLASFPAAYWLVSLPPWVRNAYDRRAALLGQAGIQEMRRRAGFAFLALALVAGVCAPSLLKPFCLTPQALVFQDGPGAGRRLRAWSEVTRVRTSCSRRGKGWKASFDIELNDGAVVSLSSFEAFRARERLGRALHGRTFAFDATEVPRECDVFGKSVLTDRP